MAGSYFENGTANVGGKNVMFERRAVRGNYFMYIPRSFSEDKNIVSNYSYYFSGDKSPLSIAVKYSAVTSQTDRDRIIAHYFSSSADARNALTQIADTGVLYRETVTESQFLSVYSLRFSVEVPDGMLLGCFNCAAAYKDDWKPVVLEMLRAIEPA